MYFVKEVKKNKRNSHGTCIIRGVTRNESYDMHSDKRRIIDLLVVMVNQEANGRKVFKLNRFIKRKNRDGKGSIP
jgi:hypothetical protein